MKRKKRWGRVVQIGLLSLGLPMAMGSASQVVYKYVDEEGRTVFTDRPPDQVAAEVLALPEGGFDETSVVRIRERTQRLTEKADMLEEDRIARERARDAQRERQRAAAQAAEPRPPEPEPAITVWYPGYWRPWLRPPHGHWPPLFPPGHRPRPPGHGPPAHLPEPPPRRPPGGRLTLPRQPLGPADQQGAGYGTR